jgi:hypothetical protein
MVAKPTNVLKCMKVYYKYSIHRTCFVRSFGHPQGGALRREGTLRYCTGLCVGVVTNGHWTWASSVFDKALDAFRFRERKYSHILSPDFRLWLPRFRFAFPQELLYRIPIGPSVFCVLFLTVLVSASLVNITVNLHAVHCYKFLCYIIKTMSRGAVVCFFGTYPVSWVIPKPPLVISNRTTEEHRNHRYQYTVS